MAVGPFAAIFHSSLLPLTPSILCRKLARLGALIDLLSSSGDDQQLRWVPSNAFRGDEQGNWYFVHVRFGVLALIRT